MFMIVSLIDVLTGGGRMPENALIRNAVGMCRQSTLRQIQVAYRPLTSSPPYYLLVVRA